MQKFAVIGLGSFGEHLARALTDSGAEVIGIDGDERVVERLRDDVALAVCMDGTDAAALKAQGVGDVDVAIVGIGEHFESAALTVAALKEIGVAKIVARAMNDRQGLILSKVGADAIASAEQESAIRWAHRLTLPRIERYVELGADHSLIYLPAPSIFCGKSLIELDLRKKFGVNLVALRRDMPPKNLDSGKQSDAAIVVVPQPETRINKGDVLVLVGHDEKLADLPVDE